MSLQNYQPTHSFRIKPFSLFSNLFNDLFLDVLNIDNISKISINFEKSIFNYIKNTRSYDTQLSSTFIQLYLNKASHLLNHLNGKYNNFNLISRIDFNTTIHLPVLSPDSLIPYTQLPFVEHSLLFPEKTRLNQNLYGQKIEVYGAESIDYESAAKCGRCKMNKVIYYTMQCRSADESETCFFTCVNCNNKWKM